MQEAIYLWLDFHFWPTESPISHWPTTAAESFSPTIHTSYFLFTPPFFYFLFCYTFLLPRPTLFFLTKNPPFLCSSSSYLRSLKLKLKLYTPTLSLPCHYFAGAGESSSLLFNFLVRQRPNTQQQFFLINYMYHTRVE